RLTDETGEWEIIARPYATNAGKDAHARVRKVGQSDVTFELRTWGAHEKVSVKRATAEEGKRCATGTKGLATRHALPARLGRDGVCRVRVGIVGGAAPQVRRVAAGYDHCVDIRDEAIL